MVMDLTQGHEELSGQPMGGRLGDGLLRTSLERLVGLACELLDTPVDLLSGKEGGRQFLVTAYGLPDGSTLAGQTQRYGFLCRYPAISDRPLIVGDSRDCPTQAVCLEVREMQVVDYAGIPLVDPEGLAAGALAVIDGESGTGMTIGWPFWPDWRTSPWRSGPSSECGPASSRDTTRG
jgi:hypothetical protein